MTVLNKMLHYPPRINCKRIVASFYKTRLNYCTNVLNQKKLPDYEDLSDAPQKLENKPKDWDKALPFEKIPGPKPFPLIGNSWRFFVPSLGNFYKIDESELLLKMNEMYGDIAILKGMPGRTPLIFLFNTNDFEKAYRSEGAWPIREAFQSVEYYRSHYRKDIFGDCTGLLTQHGEEWFKIRTLVNPILMKPRNVEQYIGKMNEIADEFVDNIGYFTSLNEQGEMPPNFIYEIYKWAQESIAYITLDKQFGCLKRDDVNPESQQILESINELLVLLSKLEFLPSVWKTITTPTWKRFVQVSDFVNELSMKYINQALEKLEKENSDKPENESSVLEKMLKQDKRVAITMANDMLLAAVDTTGKTLGAALYFLAKHPKKQTLLREEALSVLSDKNTPVTKEILSKSVYLKSTLKETLRFVPPGLGRLRTTVKDLVLGGFQVPKGSQLMFGNVTLCLRDEHFARANEFLPERWLESSGELSYKKAHPLVYSPFGKGPRSCIGQRIANLELEIALLKIIRNFEVSWPHEDMRFRTKFLYGLVDPLKLHVRPLN